MFNINIQIKFMYNRFSRFACNRFVKFNINQFGSGLTTTEVVAHQTSFPQRKFGSQKKGRPHCGGGLPFYPASVLE